MAAKVFFLLALIAVVVSADDCNCDPPTEEENRELWNFLKKLSSALDDPEDREIRAVLPGELSPLLECNCLEKNRKKRNLLPEVEEASEQLNSLESMEGVELVRQRKSIHFRTPRCPEGHAWIGIKCVREEFLD